MKEIMLQNTDKGVMAAIYRDGKPDPEIVALFGTHRLPTAWRCGDAREIAENISELNPGAIVEWV